MEHICLENMSVGPSAVYPAEWLPHSSVIFSLPAPMFWDRPSAPVDTSLSASIRLGPQALSVHALSLRAAVSCWH